MTYDAPLSVGDEITIGRALGVTRELGPRRPDGESRLVIELLLQDDDVRQGSWAPVSASRPGRRLRRLHQDANDEARA
jgi:hypothetical protein